MLCERTDFKSRNACTGSTLQVGLYFGCPESSLMVATCIQEVLAQMEKQERLDKLEETFQAVREDYLRILGKLR